MGYQTKQEFRYRSTPTATLEQIVEAYKASQCTVGNDFGGRPTLLREVRHLQSKDFDLFSATYIDDARISMRHSDDVIAFILPTEGHVEVSLKSRKILSTTGAIAVPGSKCREMKLPAGTRQIRIGVPSRRFQNHVRTTNGQAACTAIRFDEAPALDREMLACLVRVIESLFYDVENLNASGALLAHKVELLEICLLAIWPNSLWRRHSANAGFIVPRHVRLAIEIIRSDPFAAPSTSELAKACNVSVRTLQHSFRRFTSYSITEFITRSRLNFIRDRNNDAALVDEIRGKIGRSAFNRLNLEHRIEYGRDVRDT